MEFDNNKPIYLQIADNLCERILSGEFKPGGRIPKVIFNQRGIGFFVAGDAIDVIRETERRKFIEEELPLFRGRAALLGINLKDFID